MRVFEYALLLVDPFPAFSFGRVLKNLVPQSFLLSIRKNSDVTLCENPVDGTLEKNESLAHWTTRIRHTFYSDWKNPCYLVFILRLIKPFEGRCIEHLPP